MRAQNAVSLGVSQKLDKAVVVVVGAGSAVGLEWELADLVLDLLLLELLFSVADPRDLRVRVDNGGNGHVVDVTDTAGQLFDDGDTFLFGLVRQHGTLDDVTNGVDVGHGGAEVVVNGHATSFVELDADLLQAQVVGEGATTHGHEHDVAVELHGALEN